MAVVNLFQNPSFVREFFVKVMADPLAQLSDKRQPF